MRKARVTRVTQMRAMDAHELQCYLSDRLRDLRDDKAPPERVNAAARIAGQMIALWRLNYQAKLRGLPTGKVLPIKS